MLIQTENGLRSFYTVQTPTVPAAVKKLTRDYINFRNESIKRYNATMVAGQRMGRWADWKPTPYLTMPDWVNQ